MKSCKIQSPNSREIPKTNIQRSKVFKGAGIALVMLGAAFATGGQTNLLGTNAAPMLAPPYGEMKPTFWEAHGVAVIVVAAVFVFAVAVVVILALQPRRIEPPAPVLVARKELSKLAGRPEDGACLSAVSRVVRRYFISAFHLAEGELNTAEFCDAMAGKPEIGADLAIPLAHFLRQCDERKFSPKPGPPPLGAVTRAEDFLAQAEARRGVIPPPTA